MAMGLSINLVRWLLLANFRAEMSRVMCVMNIACTRTGLELVLDGLDMQNGHGHAVQSCPPMRGEGKLPLSPSSHHFGYYVLHCDYLNKSHNRQYSCWYSKDTYYRLAPTHIQKKLYFVICNVFWSRIIEITLYQYSNSYYETSSHCKNSLKVLTMTGFTLNGRLPVNVQTHNWLEMLITFGRFISDHSRVLEGDCTEASPVMWIAANTIMSGGLIKTCVPFISCHYIPQKHDDDITCCFLHRCKFIDKTFFLQLTNTQYAMSLET